MKLENRVQNSRLRLPIYLFTIISGVIMFIEPGMLVITLFIFFLGFLLLFETIHPAGYDTVLFKPMIPKFFPNNIQTSILLVLKFIFIIFGLFLMFLGVSIGLSSTFR